MTIDTEKLLHQRWRQRRRVDFVARPGLRRTMSAYLPKMPPPTAERPVSLDAARVDIVDMGLIVGLLVIWLILAVLGLVIKGLVWLFIIGLVLFIATGIYGWIRHRA